MRIGDLDLGEHPVLLAPMEDVTDTAFRLLCRKMGAGMVYSEFVASDALVRGVNRSLEKLRVTPEERPVAIQIYGRFVEAMRDAADMVAEEAKPDVIDLNFGCPVKKVASKGAGAGLLRNIPLMLDIARAVVEAVPHIPVTAKTRLGWDSQSLVIETLAEQLQDCGIKALAIHGRTRAQLYSGEADWEPIGRVKANPRMRIPVIGNGDVTTPERALECFERYGVDAIMVGRASFGAPWVFREMRTMLDGNPTRMTTPEKLTLLRQQVTDSVTLLGERRGILHSRRHLANTPLFKGIPDFRPVRTSLLRAETMAEVFRIIDEEITPRLPSP